MNFKKIFFPIALIIFAAALTAPAYGAESEMLKAFLQAYDSNNAMGMTAVVEKNQDKVPGEIKDLIEQSKLTTLTHDERAEKLYTAELLAREYNNITGDSALLVEIKQIDFNTRLDPPVRPKASRGIQTVEIPPVDEITKKVFKPDNIIIKAGETVRWVNKDKVIHIFASMPLIGEVGIFSPNLEPGKNWEYKFEKPGEYYYLCFIHQGMVGKITVEGEKKETGETKDEKGMEEKKLENVPEKPEKTDK